MVSSPSHVEKAPELVRRNGQLHHFTDEQTEARVPQPRLQDNKENKDILPTGQVIEVLHGLGSETGQACPLSLVGRRVKPRA